METPHDKYQKRFVGMDSVVQVNEQGPKEFIGCFVIVSSMLTWGIQGRLPILPTEKGTVWINLKWEQMEYIGQAILKPQPQHT